MELVEAQLDERFFAYLPGDHAEYWNKDFGAQVLSRFSKLAEDIAEAGKCFAAGRYTASVFHLMRIMEAGVGLLAKRLDTAITTDRSWGTILSKVNAAIRALPGALPAPPRRTRNGMIVLLR